MGGSCSTAAPIDAAAVTSLQVLIRTALPSPFFFAVARQRYHQYCIVCTYRFSRPVSQQEFALFLARFENARAALGGNHHSSLLRLKVLPS
jgi:hypothetical protein